MIEDNLRHLGDNVKCTHSNYKDPRKKKRERERGKKIFEEIIVENYPNKRKEIANQVQEAQRA